MSHPLPPESGIRWLGFKPWRAEQEGDHFFVSGRTCIHRTMHPRIWLVPIDHARAHGNLDLFPCLAELQGELLTAYDDREAMAGIRMPRHRLARFEDQPTNHEIVAPRDDF